MAMAAGVHGQNSFKGDKLIGTWSLDYQRTIGSIKAEARQHLDSLDANKKSAIQQSFSQRKFIFNGDGTFMLTVNSERSISGTWILKDDGRTLELSSEGLVNRHTIANLSNQNLELELEKSTATKQLLGKWYLNKTSN